MLVIGIKRIVAGRAGVEHRVLNGMSVLVDDQAVGQGAVAGEP